MPVLTAPPSWKRFKAAWQNCDQCELCQVRKNIVLAKGKIPCDVLFVGEAPGASEDATGLPFIGPAGKLLDEQIAEALENADKQELRLCYTNLVCCIPKEYRLGTYSGPKIGEPLKEHIEACRQRLEEFMFMCNPRLIVAVGDLSKKWLGDKSEVSITHPAAILRAEIVRQALMRQKSVVVLENAFREL